MCVLEAFLDAGADIRPAWPLAQLSELVPGGRSETLTSRTASGTPIPSCGARWSPQRAADTRTMAGTHPDVTLLATEKVVIAIDEVRDLIMTA
ncbi:hypothetical protein AB0I32_25655, partial [Promicromonospora sp. NPDC050249]